MEASKAAIPADLATRPPFAAAAPSPAALAGVTITGKPRQHAEREDVAGSTAGQSAFHEGKHPFLQNLATSREPLLDGVLGQIKFGRHMLDRTILPVVKDQRFAIQLGHALQRAPQDSLLLLVYGEVRSGLVA